MQKLGNVADNEMFRTFNMGIGMIVVTDEENAESLALDLGANRIGKITSGDGSVHIL